MSAPATGQIHDLGYKRYVGERRARDTRWTVIMRHQVSTGWKTWWRYFSAPPSSRQVPDWFYTPAVAGNTLFANWSKRWSPPPKAKWCPPLPPLLCAPASLPITARPSRAPPP